jgi:hypothetical protein
MLRYIVNYIDRVNVRFAALTMNNDLGFSPGVCVRASRNPTWLCLWR